jgi:NAD dependent epimerase/dehydratase family enzyme
MRTLRRAWGARLGLPASRWMLALGAFVLRTETELILKSRRVVPGRLLDAGFRFDFPAWPAAAEDLCRRWKNQRTNNQHSSPAFCNMEWLSVTSRPPAG